MEKEKSKIDTNRDVEGAFPIFKAMQQTKMNQPFDLVIKGVKLIDAKRKPNAQVLTKSQGGGGLVFSVGGSIWEVKFTHNDMELKEGKVIIHGR